MIKQVQEIPRLLMDAHDTARALAISERKLWELTNKGEIPSVRIGRRVLYNPGALQGWIDGQAGKEARRVERFDTADAPESTQTGQADSRVPKEKIGPVGGV